MRNLLRDLVFAFRSFGKAPGTAALAVATLALGIGANVAIFSVLRAVVLEPLPYPEPDRLVHVSREHSFSTAQARGYAERLQSFDALAAAAGGTVVLLGDGPPRVLGASIVGPGYFDVFSASPALGRLLQPGDTRPGSEPVAVLTESFWRTELGADPEILGRVLQLSGEGAEQRTVVGVVAQQANPLPWASDVLLPVQHAPGSHEDRDMMRYWLLGKLSAGLPLASADLEVQEVAAQLALDAPDLFGDSTVLRAGATGYLASRTETVRSSIWLLFGAVGLVLLVACTNIALLLLSRSAARRQEISVRQALGASRRRLLQQLLTESAALALVGGTAGVFVGLATLGAMRPLLPARLPRAENIELDAPALLFALVASLVAGLLAGLPPALRSSRQFAGDLKRRPTLPWNGPFVVAQVALGLVLVTCAGLLLKSFWKLQQVDPGFRPQQVVSLHVTPPASRYGGEPERQALFEELVDAIAAVPGVVQAGAINILPLTPSMLGVGISPDGQRVAEGAESKIISYRSLTPGALETLGVPLLEGRAPTPADRSGAEPVGLVNRRLAEELWPEGSALGREVVWGTGETWFRVVGVVENMRQHSLARNASSEAYLPYGQEAWVPSLHLVARLRGDLETPWAALRDAVWQVDPNLPITREAELADLARTSLSSERFYLVLFGAFGLLALTLSAFGVFGTTSYRVSRQTREIGVRMALGASRGQIVRSFVRDTARLAAVGSIVGLSLALVSTRLLSRQLFEVAPTDPWVLLVGLFVLGGVTTLAGWLPARQAARADPHRALRSD